MELQIKKFIAEQPISSFFAAERTEWGSKRELKKPEKKQGESKRTKLIGKSEIFIVCLTMGKEGPAWLNTAEELIH